MSCYERIWFFLIGFSLLMSPFQVFAGDVEEASSPARPEVLFGAIEGKVWDLKTKKEIPGARVKIEGGSIKLTTQTHPDGGYRFASLPLGKYKISAEKDGFNPTTGIITLNSQEFKVNIELEAQTGFLDGVVRDNDNRPIKGVEVSLVGTTYKTVTDGDGAYIFNDLPVGEYQLAFTHPGYLADNTRKAVIFSQSITTIKVILLPDIPGQVSGKIVDAATGEPLVDVEVMVQVAENVITDYSKPDGSFLIKGLEPGRYKVTLSREGYNTKITSVLVSATEGKVFNFTMTPLVR